MFIQENAFESVACEIAAILSQPQCVNKYVLRLNTPASLHEKLFVYALMTHLLGEI